MNQPASAYFSKRRRRPAESHTLSVLGADTSGRAARRDRAFFPGRGYNIESLTVSETRAETSSRITIVTTDADG